MIKFLAIFLMVVACSHSGSVWAEAYRLANLVQEAHDLREEGRFRKAIKLYLEAAEAGNPEAMNAIGIMAVNGMGMSKNEARGFKYVKDAAELGYAEAQKNLAEFYEKGIRVKKNQAKADYWYAKYESHEKDDLEISEDRQTVALANEQNSEKEVSKASDESDAVQFSLTINDGSSPPRVVTQDCGAEITKGLVLQHLASKFRVNLQISNSPLSVECNQNAEPLDEVAAQPIEPLWQLAEEELQPVTKKALSVAGQKETPQCELRSQSDREEAVVEHLASIWDDMNSVYAVRKYFADLDRAYQVEEGTFLGLMAYEERSTVELIVNSRFWNYSRSQKQQVLDDALRIRWTTGIERGEMFFVDCIELPSYQAEKALEEATKDMEWGDVGFFLVNGQRTTRSEIEFDYTCQDLRENEVSLTAVGYAYHYLDQSALNFKHQNEAVDEDDRRLLCWQNKIERGVCYAGGTFINTNYRSSSISTGIFIHATAQDFGNESTGYGEIWRQTLGNKDFPRPALIAVTGRLYCENGDSRVLRFLRSDPGPNCVDADGIYGVTFPNICDHQLVVVDRP